MKPFKIIVTGKDDIESVKTKIDSAKPKAILLETSEANFQNAQITLNQKTTYIAQKLSYSGWKIEKLKYYKGKLFKVMLSNKKDTETKNNGSTDALKKQKSP